MSKSLRQRKKYPYYKIQVYDELVKVWKDERKVFDTVEAAQGHINNALVNKSARIIVVERDSRHVLDSQN
jgi:hypothetical protein